MTYFKIAAVFSDNMVLQRDKNINIFGKGDDGLGVTVEFAGQSVSTKVVGGAWKIVLAPCAAAENLSLTVTCSSGFSRTFSNIAVGEVWLAGGQSNMELELQNCKNGKETLENDKDVSVRFYYTQKNCYIDEKFYADEANTGWSLFDSESAKCWSAVGYFFARDLAKKLGVTVGVIGCNWGGTSASYWMSRASLEKDVDLKTYLDEYDNAIAGKTEAELTKEYADYIAYDKAWFEKSQAFYAEHPDGSWDEVQEVCGKNLYPGPLCPRNPFHATALYESMLKRVCPYTIKGVIYYQGETDDCKPKIYYKLYRELINLWRSDWEDDELPFIAVQLPMHRYKADPDWKHWCYIREAQMKAYKTIKNTGICVAIDCGEFNEIHPKNKQPVGERLALQALYNFYGQTDIKAFSPMYKSMLIKNNCVELTFEHCESLHSKGEAAGFEVAGADKKFVAADKIEFDGNKIIVAANGVAEPFYVRYLWTNYAEVTIYGDNDLPLAPFRTSMFDEQ